MVCLVVALTVRVVVVIVVVVVVMCLCAVVSVVVDVVVAGSVVRAAAGVGGVIVVSVPMYLLSWMIFSVVLLVTVLLGPVVLVNAAVLV